ncbi:MAG: ABC transporter permease [Caldilineae bacterium]|nr:MAG: ABC transporter permease [Caldilineae bacterium]
MSDVRGVVPLLRMSLVRIRRRPLQYLLFVVGVAVGVAMMVSIDLANASSRRAFQRSTEAIVGRATHRIVGGPGGLDEGLYVRLRRDLGYRQAAPVVEGFVLAVDEPERPLRLLGVDPLAEAPFRAYFAGGQVTGDLTQLFTRPDTIVLPESLARRLGVGVGDSIELEVSGRRVRGWVAGLLQPRDPVAQQGLRNVVLADLSTAQEVLGWVGRLSYIDLIVQREADLARIADILPAGARLEPAGARSNAVQQMIAAFELNLSALSLLALVVGMFLIYNTVTFSVVQRRQLFGLLRVLGATGEQMFALVLIEAGLLALVGTVLGLGLGILLGRGMVVLVTRTINDIYFVLDVQGVDVPLPLLLKGLIVGVSAALLATLPPALEARGTAPNSSLQRSTLESQVSGVVPWLAPSGTVLVVLGGLLLVPASMGLAVTFAGLFAVLLGLAIFTPPVTLGVMRMLARPASWVLGPAGRMAPRDIARSLSRTSVAIAALMTAVAVIIGVSIMIGSFRKTVENWLNATLQADVYVAPPGVTTNQAGGTLSEEVVERVARWPGVEQALFARSTTVYVTELGRDVHLLAVSGDIARGDRPVLWQESDVEEVWARLAAGEGVFISEPLFRRAGWRLPPPRLTLHTALGPRTFPVLAVLYDYASDQGTIWMDLTLYQELWQDRGVTSAALFVAPEVDVDALIAALEEGLGGYQRLVINSSRGLRQASLQVFDRTFAVTAALQLLAMVVAFIGMLSALLSLQLERTRELGILRSLGMTVRDLWQLTLLETGLMGGMAGLLAMPTGFVLAWILIYVINLRSFGWTLEMQLQPRYFLQAFLLAVVAALLAGVYPSFRLGRMVVADAIRHE